MKGSLFQKIIALLLVVSMTFINVLFTAVNFVYALSESEVIIEGGKVKFNAYFKNDNEEKVYEKNVNVLDGTQLYIDIELEQSKLENAKILLGNTNFKIQDNIKNDYIDYINTQSGEIVLKTIDSNQKVELEIPIMFEKKEKVNIDYFSKEIEIALTGTYYNSSEIGKNIENATIQLKLNWYEEEKSELETEHLVEKTIMNKEKNRIIIQEKIETKAGFIPKLEEKITAIVPKINNEMPDTIYILQNGVKVLEDKILSGYNVDEGTLEYTHYFMENNIIDCSNSTDIYKVIYVFSGKFDAENLLVQNGKLQISTKILGYSKNIESEQYTDTIEMGNGTVASIEALSEKKEIYKGFLYSNAENGTDYFEKYDIEISDKEQVQNGITINFENDIFKTEEEEIETNEKTNYKKISISSDNFREILGENGEIKVITDNENFIINSSLPTTEEGTIELELNTHTLRMETSMIENEGNLVIRAKKTLVGDCGLDKESIQKIQKIVTTMNVNTKQDEIPVKADIETILKEPKTEASLQMTNENRTNILASNHVNNVEIIATLKTGTEDTYLYKEPTLEITLPIEVEEVSNLNATALYAENELVIKSTNVKEKEGKKVIEVEIDGTSTSFDNKITNGIKVTISAKMVIGQYVPSRVTKLVMEYKNENSASIPEPVELPISIYSPYGLIKDLILNGDEGKLQVGAVLINNYAKSIEDLAIIGTMPNNEVEQESFENTIKDTYKTKLKSANSENETGAIEEITGNEIIIKYSKDKENWGDSIESAKYYKIFINTKEANTLNDKEAIYLEYQIENLKKNPQFEIVAVVDGEEELLELPINAKNSSFPGINEEDSKDKTEDLNSEEEKNQDEEEEKNTNPEEEENVNPEGDENTEDKDKNNSDNEEEENTEEEIKENLQKGSFKVDILAQSGNKKIDLKDTLKKGQAVNYKYKIQNISKKSIKNMKITVEYNGANIFGEYSYKNQDSLNTDEMKEFTVLQELDGISKFQFNINELKINETKEIEVQIIVKDNVNLLQTSLQITADEIEAKKVRINNKVEEAELKPLLLNNVSTNSPLIQLNTFQNILQIENLTDNKLENVEIEMVLPETAVFDDIDEYSELVEIKDGEINKRINGYSVEELDDYRLKIKLDDMILREIREIEIPVKINKNTGEDLNIYFTVTTSNGTYYSNIVNIPTQEVAISNVKISQKSNKENQELEIGDEIIYSFSIQNYENQTKFVSFSDTVGEELYVVKTAVEQGEDIEEDEDICSNLVYKDLTLEPNSMAKIDIYAEVNYKSKEVEKIQNVGQIDGNYFVATSNIVENKTNQNLEEENNEEEETQNEIINEPNDEETNIDLVLKDESEIKQETRNEVKVQNNNTPAPQESGTMEVKNSISGMVWLDENKNGIKEENEKAISGITVMLANTQTGDFVKDKNGNRIETRTNSLGKYVFEQIEPGKYMVIFAYDSTKYRNTQYQANGALANTNSDIITSKINVDNNQIKYGITDTLLLENESLQNIDAGLIENEIFDLSLEKYISKVTIQNTKGTTVKEFNKAQLAKIEIDAKVLSSSTLLIEYTIEITNEGELPGYASEIVDYLPKDLSFSSEINPTWYKSTDGNIHTNELSEKIINPGETAQIKLILTKTMTENNTGVTTNKAEIAKSSNNLSILDIDSTNGNNILGEDDISNAELIISIRTGIEYTISIIITIIILTILGIVIYTRKRKETNYEIQKYNY